MTALHNLTVAQMSKALTEKQFSSREATQYFLDRIAQLDKTYNSFITVTAEQALQEADAADARRAVRHNPQGDVRNRSPTSVGQRKLRTGVE